MPRKRKFEYYWNNIAKQKKENYNHNWMKLKNKKCWPGEPINPVRHLRRSGRAGAHKPKLTCPLFRSEDLHPCAHEDALLIWDFCISIFPSYITSSISTFWASIFNSFQHHFRQINNRFCTIPNGEQESNKIQLI